MTASDRTIVLVPRRRQMHGGAGGSRARALGVVLAVAFSVSALQSAFYGQRPALLLTLGVLGVLVAAALALGLPTSKPALLATAGLTALLAWTAASLLWAESVDRAWTEADRLLLYAAVLAVATMATRTIEDANRVVVALAAGAAAVALWTLGHVVAGDPGAFVEHRLEAPIGYVNGNAGLFLMGLWPAVAAGVGLRTRPLPAVAALSAAALQANLLVLTQSRAVLPALAVSLTVVLLLSRERAAHLWAVLAVAASVTAALPWTLDVYAGRTPGEVTAPGAAVVRAAGLAMLLASLAAGAAWWAALRLRRRRVVRRLAPVLAVALVAVGLGAAVAAIGDPVASVKARWQQFSALEVRDEPATSRFGDVGGFRYDLWRIALLQWREEPWLGVGAGGYAAGYLQHRRTLEAVRQPHSVQLQLLAEGGVPALAFFLVVVGAVGYGTVRLARQRTPQTAMVVCGAGGLVTAWLAHTSVDWLHLLPGVTGMALVGAAALCVGPASDDPGPRGQERRSRLSAIAVVVVAAIGAAAVGRHYAAEVHASRAAAAVASAPADALHAATVALRLNPADVDAHVSRAAALARLGEAAGADAELRAALRDEPRNYVLHALRGDLAVRRGRLQQARRHYGASAALNPREPGLRELVDDPSRALP